MQQSQEVTSAKYHNHVVKLQASIKYSQEDVPSSRSLIEQLNDDDVDALVNRGCLLYLEGLEFSLALVLIA